jgi:hypothetical protein
MTSKYFFSLALIGTGAALGTLGSTGCGGGNNGPVAAGGGTTTHTTTHSTSSNSSTTMGTGGSSTGHDITSAVQITVNMPASGTLVDFQTPDWYTFAGKKGERLTIQVVPQNLTGFTDPTLLDPAWGLIGPNMDLKMPLTYQNGAIPYNGQVAIGYVELPMDGNYYLQVSDCNGFFQSGCPNDPTQIVDFSYNLGVFDTSMLTKPELVAAATQDGTTAKADTITWKAGAQAGSYVDSLLGGDWKSATDTQVFQFVPPANAKGSTGGHPRVDFYFQPTGGMQGGDLSNASAKAWITDMTGTTILAQADQNNYTSMTLPLDLSVQFTPGSTYYLFVQNTGTPPGSFYFATQTANTLFDVAELEVYDPTKPASMQAHTNDTAATAEVLMAVGQAKTLFTVDGNISAPGTATTPDVDWFTFTVPAKVTMYGYQCDSQRSGSGLGSFTIELFQSDNTTAIGTAASESAAMDLLLNPPAALPTGVAPGSKMFFKVSAATQDAMNTGNQYRCYVFFQ